MDSCPQEKAPRLIELDRASTIVSPFLRNPAAATALASSASAAPAAPSAPSANEDLPSPPSMRAGMMSEDEDEAELLGISSDKKRRKSDAKKTSESDKLTKELSDLEGEFRQLLASLKSFPPELPDKFGYNLGKVDRAASRLQVNLKKANNYENLPSIVTMIEQIGSTRDLIKASTAFFSGKTGMNKKHEEPFYNTFKKVQSAHPHLIGCFSSGLETRFIDVGYSRDLKASDWPSVAGYMALQKQIEVHGGDEEGGEKGSVALAEKLVAYLVEELPKSEEAGGQQDLVLEYVKPKFLEATEEALKRTPAEKVSEALSKLRLVLLCSADGLGTMDSTMSFLEKSSSKPVVRVFVSSVLGKRYIELAKEANMGMQARAMINVSIHKTSQDIFGLQTAAEWELLLRS